MITPPRAERDEPGAAAAPSVRLRDATCAFGPRVLWSGLDLDVAPGEFVAVLGPNGAGKSTLLKVLLGEVALRSGTAEVAGAPATRGSREIGYVPQQGTLPEGGGIRGVDLVGLGLDGHRWGIGLPTRRRRDAIDRALDLVGARSYAKAPLDMLSGGERQRLRIAQAVVTRPRVLLCDEPLLSLDLHHQRAVANLVHDTQVAENMSVLFVTHEINPILSMVDRVVYIAGGHAVVGTPREVMRSEVLSRLYGTRVDVLEHDGRLIVLGGDDEARHHEHGSDHERGVQR